MEALDRDRGIYIVFKVNYLWLDSIVCGLVQRNTLMLDVFSEYYWVCLYMNDKTYYV